MEDIVQILKLSKDIKDAAATLDKNEVRFLVDAYYTLQGDRIRAANQARSLEKSGEPHGIITWLEDQSSFLEQQVKGALQMYVKNHPAGKWLISVHGIGPVISAGLLAHIDIEKATYAGNIWSYAGIDKGKLEKVWEKGQKRPWNATLKILTWKAGESFVKVSGKEEAVYGQMYRVRKDQELAANEAGRYADTATAYLAKYKFGKDTEAYKAYSVGKLPAAHIHARAKRFAVKMFLSHFHQVWRELEGLPVPAPYVIAHKEHHDYIPPIHYLEAPAKKPKAAKVPKEPKVAKTKKEKPKAVKPRKKISLEKGNSVMGMTKHRTSGHATKNPGYKMSQTRDANKELERVKKKPRNPVYSSVKELLDKGK